MLPSYDKFSNTPTLLLSITTGGFIGPATGKLGANLLYLSTASCPLGIWSSRNILAT